MPVKRDSSDVHKHFLGDDSVSVMSASSETQHDDFQHNDFQHNDLDVDELVNTLTNKLCLKSKHSLCRQTRTRMSPYHTFSKTNSSVCCLHCKYFSNNNDKNKLHQNKLHDNKLHHRLDDNKEKSMSDPYELMQELLKEGALIKEAVRRLAGRQAEKKTIDFYEYSDDENYFNGDENAINLANS